MANEIALQGLHPINPWQVVNPNSDEIMQQVYNPSFNQGSIQTQQQQTSSQTLPGQQVNWNYVFGSQMFQGITNSLAHLSPNSRQNAVRKYNEEKFNPLNYLPSNPNISLQDQYGMMKKGGTMKYADGGSTDEDADWNFLFGDEQQQSQSAPTEEKSKKQLRAEKMAGEEAKASGLTQEHLDFFNNLMQGNKDAYETAISRPRILDEPIPTDPEDDGTGFASVFLPNMQTTPAPTPSTTNSSATNTDYGTPKSGNPYAAELYSKFHKEYGAGNLGVWGDTAHKTRESDHNSGNAIDLTYKSEEDRQKIIAELQQDPKVKYVISKGQIWNPSISDAWRPSHGHDHHIHVSIKKDGGSYTEGNEYDVDDQEVARLRKLGYKVEIL